MHRYILYDSIKAIREFYERKVMYKESKVHEIYLIDLEC